MERGSQDLAAVQISSSGKQPLSVVKVELCYAIQLEWNRGYDRLLFRDGLFIFIKVLEDNMGFISYVKEEMQVIMERDAAIKTPMEVFLYPSFKAIMRHRVAHWLYEHKHYFMARWYSQRTVRKTGIEIHPGATIGKGLFIDHGNGVIIGETTVIGDNVTLYQGVTLGGTGKEQGKRHPTIGNNVMISAGAKVLGSFTVGENSKIGAGSVVLSEVPPNCTVVGVPGRVVKRDNLRIPREDMDQVHLPDPVKNDIDGLRKENERLSKMIDVLLKNCPGE